MRSISGQLWCSIALAMFAAAASGVSAECQEPLGVPCVQRTCADNVTSCSQGVNQCGCAGGLTLCAARTTEATCIVQECSATTTTLCEWDGTDCACPNSTVSTGCEGKAFLDCERSTCVNGTCTWTNNACSCPATFTTTGSTTATPSCVPKTCEADVDCGTISDGCSGSLDCGGCDAYPNSFCAANNTCQCIPKNCSQLGLNECNAMNVSDGCGQTILAGECGTCTGSTICLDGTCQDAACNQTTSCQQENRTCGTLSIGQAPCTNVSCGLCSSTETCTIDGQCSCTTSNTCDGRCGVVDLGCGQVDCLGCTSASEICVATQCVSSSSGGSTSGTSSATTFGTASASTGSISGTQSVSSSSSSSSGTAVSAGLTPVSSSASRIGAATARLGLLLVTCSAVLR